MKYNELHTVRNKMNMSQTICLFGMGALLKECLEQVILTLGKTPDYFCDNSAEKWGTVCQGITCLSPEELVNISGDVLVIIAVKNYEIIVEQLEAGGIHNILLITYGRTYDAINGVRVISSNQALDNTNHSLPMKGRWALITGASRGIGYQIAVSMAELGANIVAHSRAHQHNNSVIKACKLLGVETLSIAADLSKSDELASMLIELDNYAHQIDILFNSAGVSLAQSSNIWQVQADIYLSTYSVNTIAPITLCGHFIPLMIEQGFGRIINVSSSIQHRPAEMAYACSKAALDKYSHDISPRLVDTGVLISSVDPGWLKTDMGGEAALHPVEDVVPGALLGAVLPYYENNHWFSAQDFTKLSLEQAIQKANFIYEL